MPTLAATPLKIRFVCSFFGCLHGHLHGFPDGSAGYHIETIIRPAEVGFEAAGVDWTAAEMSRLSPVSWGRLLRRAVESAGAVEIMNFFVKLPDPAEPDGGSIRRLVETANRELAGSATVEWIFVIPTNEWQERLRIYHGRKSGREVGSPPPSFPGIEALGLPVRDIEPADVLAFLSSLFPSYQAPALPPTVEGFVAHDNDSALLVTADCRIFATWRALSASPVAAHLPDDWEIHMPRFWYLLAHTLPLTTSGLGKVTA